MAEYEQCPGSKKKPYSAWPRASGLETFQGQQWTRCAVCRQVYPGRKDGTVRSHKKKTKAR